MDKEWIKSELKQHFGKWSWLCVYESRMEEAAKTIALRAHRTREEAAYEAPESTLAEITNALTECEADLSDLVIKRSELRQEVIRLKAQVVAMTKAPRDVEWVPDDLGELYCPWCGAKDDYDNHHPWCKREQERNVGGK